MRKGRNCLSLLLALLLLLSVPVLARAAGEDGSDSSSEQKAKNLSKFIQFESCGHADLKGKLINSALTAPETFVPYERFNISWDPTVAARWLCIQWGTMPQHVRLLQYDPNDVLLAETAADEEYDTILPLAEGTAKVSFLTERPGMTIAHLGLYSEGVLPDPFYGWKKSPGHLDYLIFSTHPDDDTLFMGGIIPTYGAEQGYVGTVAYVTTPNRLRVNEAVMGVWAMGSVYYPFFLEFRDLNDQRKVEHRNKFLPEAVTLAVVRFLRQQRPLVVFTHDVNGEYGHWQHKIVSAAVLEACKLAADESYDPASARAYGTWEVKKCYIHLYPENPLVMDISTPLVSMGGKTALEIAGIAYAKHRTQQNGHHLIQGEKDTYAMNRFGMAYGTVEAGQDVFDNIDPKLLVSSLYPDFASAPAA